MDWTVGLVVIGAGVALGWMLLRRLGVVRSRGGSCCGSGDAPAPTSTVRRRKEPF